MKIRHAELKDVAVIAELIHELAIYERAEGEVRVTHDDLRASLFGSEPRVYCELVELDDGDVVGFAVWFLNFSTWTGHHGLYLEDLYVRPAHRGQGLGRSLLAELAAHCVSKGYSRLQFSALDWNTPAIEFYRSLGAEAMSEWTVYRFSGASLAQLAASAKRPS
jgi:ribosomal protein S18 acetylase RimI-like enzyme